MYDVAERPRSQKPSIISKIMSEFPLSPIVVALKFAISYFYFDSEGLYESSARSKKIQVHKLVEAPGTPIFKVMFP